MVSKAVTDVVLAELSAKPSEAREEGELSSSSAAEDDDENPDHHSTAISEGPNLVTSVDTVVQKNQADLGDSQSRRTTQSAFHKNIDKTAAQRKSSMPGKSNPLTDDRSLVICFSDEDSGTDSESYRHNKASASKVNTISRERNRRMPVSSMIKSNKSEHNVRMSSKVPPRKMSYSRTFASPMAKANGSNSRVSRPSTLAQGSCSWNTNTIKKTSVNQELCGVKGMGLRNTKLQDLRQKIALREAELKLKAAQQSISSSSLDHTTVIAKNDSARKCISTSADASLETEEPDRKRFKVDRSYSSMTVGRKENFDIAAAISDSTSKDPAIVNCRAVEKDTADRHRKDSPLGGAEMNILKLHKQEHYQAVSSQGVPCALRNGREINAMSNQFERHGGPVGPVGLKQHLLTENTISNVYQNNLNHVDLFIHPSGQFSSTAAALNNLRKGSEHDIIFGQTPLGGSFNNACQDASNNVSPDNHVGATNTAANGATDSHSWLEMEEMVDRELEEAQEHRRLCEIEERNALKAYRKAQRALFEANAQCMDLYHKREAFSSEIRRSILDNSQMVWSARQHGHLGQSLNFGCLVPISDKQAPAYTGMDQHQHNSNIQDGGNVPFCASYQHMGGQNLVAETCSEPDDSTSEPLSHRGKETAGWDCSDQSPSHGSDSSANEDDNETSPPVNVSVQPNSDHHIGGEESEGKGRKLYSKLNGRCGADNDQDPLLLEATLRSELFARLGKRKSSQDGSAVLKIGLGSEVRAANYVAGDKGQSIEGNAPVYETEKDVHANFRGNEKDERSVYDPSQIQKQRDVIQNSVCTHSSADDIDDQGYLSREDQHLMNLEGISSLVLRSAFNHLKRISSIDFKEQSRNQYQDNNCRGSAFSNADRTQWSNTAKNSMGSIIENLFSEETSYTCSTAIDPNWPLCMFELRGKCNNDECPWQHIRNNNIKETQHNNGPDMSDCLVRSTQNSQKGNDPEETGRRYNQSTSPTYFVGLDILKSDAHVYKSDKVENSVQCWKRCFTVGIATTSLFSNDYSVDEESGCDGRIELLGKQFSYFPRNGILNSIKQISANTDQALEIALLVLNQDSNIVEGIKKALAVLSRALEIVPTSEVLWTVYLLMYYSSKKSMGKDDMFLYAVKLNRESYVLWLMYINSRKQLNERLAAYDAALSALCPRASIQVGTLASACILDLFLQMMDCLCMSGNVDKAIEKCYGLFRMAALSDETYHLLLADLLSCLTVSDKFVFWVCYIYLVVYRKLPDAVVQRFECEKELLGIEWPLVHLTEEEKQITIKLVETAVGSVDKYIYESGKNEANLRSAQLFALNHIRCMVALNSTENLRDLLDKYINLYPSCIELILVSARSRKQDIYADILEFEETISKWPKDVPGIHCIWNQCVEHVLQKERFDLAKELLSQWYHSVWLVQYPQNRKFNGMEDDNLHDSQSVQKSVPENSGSYPKQMDVMFAYLNLSLYNFLENDHSGAHLAIDNAMKVVSWGDINHSIRNYAVCLLSDTLLLKECFTRNCQKISKIFLKAPWVLQVPDPLSRKFLSETKKPRLQLLMSNILSPVSLDCSVINMILELWHGPALVPETFNQQKYLVDFVEAVLCVVPSNFQLAIAVCKHLSKNYNMKDVNFASLWYWACSNLVSSIFNSIPIPPEYVWVEAGGFLQNAWGTEAMSERFYKRAIMVYPFSLRLWKSLYDLSKRFGDASFIVQIAKERGIELNECGIQC